MAVRINKYLAEHGYCSRREADRLIDAGVVFVNGKRAVAGHQVEETDRVEVLNRRPKNQTEKVYFLLNKPAGYSTNLDRYTEKSVLKLVPSKLRLFPVGRLDVEASGLLIVTNDGELEKKLTHQRYEHDVEYDIILDKCIGDGHMRSLTEGITLGKKKTLPAIIKRQSDREFSIIMQEGGPRQIRRMCNELGYTVRTLTRTRIRTVKLGTLQEGKTRELTGTEISALKQ